MEKSAYVRGSELWENKFNGLLICNILNMCGKCKRINYNYDNDSGPGKLLRSQSLHAFPVKWHILHIIILYYIVEMQALWGEP